VNNFTFVDWNIKIIQVPQILVDNFWMKVQEVQNWNVISTTKFPKRVTTLPIVAWKATRITFCHWKNVNQDALSPVWKMLIMEINTCFLIVTFTNNPEIVLLNPCLVGEPLKDAKDMWQTCPFENLVLRNTETFCAPGYFCHHGGSEDTTVCCPKSTLINIQWKYNRSVIL